MKSTTHNTPTPRPQCGSHIHTNTKEIDNFAQIPSEICWLFKGISINSSRKQTKLYKISFLWFSLLIYLFFSLEKKKDNDHAFKCLNGFLYSPFVIVTDNFDCRHDWLIRSISLSIVVHFVEFNFIF